MGALAVYFYDVVFFGMFIIDRFKRDGYEEIEPTQFRAADALEIDEVKGYAEGGICVMGVMGGFSKLFFYEVEHGGLADGAGDGDDAGRPTF